MSENLSSDSPHSSLPAGCVPTLVFFGLLSLAIVVQLGRLVLFFGDVITNFHTSLVLTSLLAAGPLWWLWRRAPAGRARAAYAAWLLALPFALFMWPVQWPEPDESQLAQIIRLVMALLYLVFLLLLFRWRSRSVPRPAWGTLPLAIGIGAIIALPWLLFGALGSPLDTFLDFFAGLLLGLCAALILAQTWFRPGDDETGDYYWGQAILGGGAAWLMLFIMVAAFGFNGSTRHLLIMVPWLGWLAVALATAARKPAAQWPAVALLLGLGTALPMMFSDTDMLALRNLATGRETIIWSLLAAFLAMLPVFVLFLLVGALRRPLMSRKARLPLLLGALGPWLVAGVVFLALGQPGFYGDRLFVILKDQADVSAAAGMADYDARRTFVYGTLVNHANLTQADLRRLLDLLRVDYTPYYLENALEVQGGWGVRLLLEAHPAVDRVLSSPVLRPLPGERFQSRGSQLEVVAPTWNQVMVRAPEVWETFGARGSGIVIGQSDSGVEWTHPELADSYRGALNSSPAGHDYNWFDPWFGDREPTDDSGHGTHTLGLANGNRLGIAPEATWIGCKNLGRNLANPALYLDCLQFMLAPFPLDGNPFTDGDPSRAAHVLNNSWGCPVDIEGCDVGAVQAAVEALRAAGIFVVVSAGNDGPECASLNTPPAIYEAVFSVGAVDANGRVTTFSSMGPVDVDGSGRIKPDIVAPGDLVTAAYPGNSYFSGSGTSQAGPHVVGVVALMWSANPDLIGDIERTEEILRATAAPYRPVSAGSTTIIEMEDLIYSLGKSGDCRLEVDTGVVPNAVSGYGVVDAFAAVQMALEE